MLDTHDLGRRPGAQHESNRTVPAPADLGIEVLGVPEGAPIEFDLRLDAVVEGVLLTADVFAPLEGECVRCLEALNDDLEVSFQELYLYDDNRDAADVEEDDEQVSLLVGELLDFETVLRDAVVLALPLQPLCSEDCPGLCIECGFRLADDPDHGHDAPIDPRWAGLADLADSEE